MHAKKVLSGKLLALLVALMLLVGCAAGATLAWLVTKTDPVVNTFTVGDINIELTEPNYKPTVDGKAKILPGDTIAKDPTVTVLENSEDCYVRMFMVIDWSAETDKWFVGEESTKWFEFDKTGSWISGDKYVDSAANIVKGHIYEFRYKNVVPYSESKTVLPALFTGINIPADLKPEQYKSLKDCTVTVYAQAIQSLGFDDADAAFAKASIPADIQARINTYYPDGPTS